MLVLPLVAACPESFRYVTFIDTDRWNRRRMP
jgi:hypothetical protein